MQDLAGIRCLYALLSSVKGDFSNTLSPPSLLAPKSMTEIPSCWIEQPSAFAAPALEADPAKRMLLVTKWFIGALKSQYYIGEDSLLGMKKPLNSFLGELFIGKSTDEKATVQMVAEQVSHHPPITACYIWDEEHACQGYAQVEMTFNGSINIHQTGRAVLHIDEYNEDYEIPVLDAKINGFLRGRLYPELHGIHSIVSSSGYISRMNFSGSRWFTGHPNSFTAGVYHGDEGRRKGIYTLVGEWNGRYTVHDTRTLGADEDVYTDSAKKVPVQVALLQNQDAWEARRAWGAVLDALENGDLKAAAAAKSEIEEGQRRLRKKEAANGTKWKPLFFTQKTEIVPVTWQKGTSGKTRPKIGISQPVWKIKRGLAKRPYHGFLTPSGRTFASLE